MGDFVQNTNFFLEYCKLTDFWPSLKSEPHLFQGPLSCFLRVFSGMFMNTCKHRQGDPLPQCMKFQDLDATHGQVITHRTCSQWYLLRLQWVGAENRSWALEL